MLSILFFVLLIQTSYGDQCVNIDLLDNDNHYPLALFSNVSYNVYNRTLIPIGNACHLLSGYFPPNFIAIAERGDCDFVTKAQFALQMNASTLIVVNYGSEIFPMSGNNDVPIIAFMVDEISGQKLMNDRYANANIVLGNCLESYPHLYMGLLIPALIALMVIMIVFVVKSYRHRVRHDIYIRIPNVRHIEIEECCEQLNHGNAVPNVACVICLDEVIHTDLDRARYLKCHHSYHKECIETWFRTKTECPMCKRKY
jgi:hypothetical protein